MRYSKSILEHNGLSWASDEYRVIYLGIPKTASTSMRHFLNIKKTGKRSVFNLNKTPGDRVNYRKFTVIREPLNRFVSGVFESFGRKETPKALKDLSSMRNVSAMMNAYLTELEKNGFSETHTAPQVAYFYDKNGDSFNFDRVLIFERLEADFKKMCKDFGIDDNLEHKQKGDKEKCSKALIEIEKNVDLKNRIKDLYKEDFELYKKIKNGK